VKAFCMLLMACCAAAGPGILAAGARDQTIYLYNCNAEYQLIAKWVHTC
jgi:hypothetical protein